MKKLFLMIFGLMVSNISIANPTYDVTNGALQNDPALCSYGYNPNCSSGNTAPPPKKIIYHDVVIPPKFGALAYSQKAGILAGAVNQNSLDAAKQEAVKRCQKSSRNTPCKVIVWVRNGCLAAAEGKVKNRFLVTQAGGNQGTVEQTALKNCQDRGGVDCRIIQPEVCALP
ncbi:hypothetical protein HMPREF3050_11265 [Neisseria sp. HMSC065D04]|jgi:hypothetical protein|uniref:DUF4189 domain-containing protein n=1 Tax=Neisseria sp. HMSC065D04 TaxID=1739542 RepID=UPI0008A1E2D3|nr:DUF4189 domain-containing protein [Neisseria sp. HMSC065D04]OFO28282.1 hypothetical protein HMPREF3050_11265 [Neisseria sp. HMSC065D04]